jgi:preprotein translocase subunit SecG
MSGFLVGFITLIHVAVCIGLMASILLQSGKGGGLAGTFGAGSSQTLFGGRGAATFLSRATTFLAITFFVTSLTLGLNASRTAGTRRSLVQEDARRRGQQQPGAGQQPGAAQPTAPQSTVPGAPGPGGPSPAGPSPAPTQPMPNGGITPQPAGPTQPAPATGGK